MEIIEENEENNQRIGEIQNSVDFHCLVINFHKTVVFRVGFRDSRCQGLTGGVGPQRTGGRSVLAGR